MTDRATRRLGGWGYEGERYPPSPGLLAWLEERLGRSTPFPAFDPSRTPHSAPRTLPSDLPAVSYDARDRLTHARGQGLPDLLRLRSGTVPAVPDAVVRPENDASVARVLDASAVHGLRVIPWGGGTSVTGGVNVLPDGPPTIALDLAQISGLASLDTVSGLATFGAGTLGPEIEDALAVHGFTLGHFPQSWELSTLGGWIVTRSSGQESLGYGSIGDLLAGVTVVAPAGRLDLRSFPASAAGPDLRELILGSEGRLGVVTRATVRVRRRPESLVVTGTMLPSWRVGLDAARDVVQAGAPLALLRLSDQPETEVAMTLGLSGRRFVRGIVRRWLAWRGAWDEGCLMLVGAAGSRGTTRTALGEAHAILRRHGGVGLGYAPGRRWLADRFHHPYLRDALLDHGIATDTLETAAPWSRLPDLTGAVRSALAAALAPVDEKVAVLCHVSHPYRDGASLYFTLFFRSPHDADAAVARWAVLKRVATTAIAEAGGTLSHHHGVGNWHAPWLEREVGRTGVAMLGAVARSLDPAGILNPHALLDPTDRLEV